MSFLGRLESLELASLDYDHPLMAGATMAEIRAAIAEVEAANADDLTETYAFWMKDRNDFSILPSGSTEWMPLAKLRYHGFNHKHLVMGYSFIIWSAADCWMIIYKKDVGSGRVSLQYSVQSLVSKEPIDYFTLKVIGGILQYFTRVPSGNPARLATSRPPTAAMTADLATLVDDHRQIGATVSNKDRDWLLHVYFQRQLGINTLS